MFYSHEILTSRQHGVATVWLVATIGSRSTIRRVTRKAILDVDVPKACGTIQQPPGAPLALKLQGNLLYGVTRVYQQQCGYVLTDAEKVQDHLQKFYRMLGSSAIDTDAGKAKRHQLILVDDPDFELSIDLPAFDLDAAGNAIFPVDSQGTTKTSSQMSPVERGSSSEHRSFVGGLQIPRSSSLSDLGLEPPFGRESSLALKKQERVLPYDLEEDLPIDDSGLRIDADGNIIEEPELPPYPRRNLPDQGDLGLMQPQQVHQSEDALPILDREGDFRMKLGEELLPETEAFPARQQGGLEEQVRSDQAVAVPIRARKPKNFKPLEADDDTRVGRDEFKSWSANYLENMERGRKSRHVITQAQARQNAFNLTFGLGVADIGRFFGIPGLTNPLAEEFAGKGLQARLLGFIVRDEEEPISRGRRRSASDAFDEEEEEERRVRPRLMNGEQQGRGGEEAEKLHIASGDEQEVEIGRREPGSAILSDLPSAPWNRQSSLVPGSSAKGSAQAIAGPSRQVEVSPLVGRGSLLHDIERYSDNAPPAFGSDGFAPLRSNDSSFSELGAGLAGVGKQEAGMSELMRETLDREDHQFLSFVERVAPERGEEGEEAHLRWVVFDDLFGAEDNKKAFAAQAFYHVLSLATKGALLVKQKGENETPFGAIQLGLRVATNKGKGKGKEIEELGDILESEEGMELD